MRRQIRVVLGMIILILSLALLIWGFLPSRRETRTQPISPTELQLPTPSSLRLDTALPALGVAPCALGSSRPSPLSASLPQPNPVF
jgi:hypothetical protein